MAVTTTEPPAAQNSRLGYLNILLGASLMSGVGIFIKMTSGLSTPTIIFFRFFFSLVAIIVIILALGGIGGLRRALASARKSIVWMTAFALFFMITVFLYFTCILNTTVSHGLLLLYIAPIYVYIMSGIIGRKFDRKTLPVIILAIFGVIILVEPPTLLMGGYSASTALGLVAGLLSGISFACQFVISHKYGLEDIDGKSRMLYSSLFATIVLLPVLLIWPPVNMAYNAPYLAGAGVIATALGGALLFEGMRTVEEKRASLASLIEPVVGVALAIIILGEHLSTYNMVGGAMIIGSIAWLKIAPEEKKLIADTR